MASCLKHKWPYVKLRYLENGLSILDGIADWAHDLRGASQGIRILHIWVELQAFLYGFAAAQVLADLSCCYGLTSVGFDLVGSWIDLFCLHRSTLMGCRFLSDQRQQQANIQSDTACTMSKRTATTPVLQSIAVHLPAKWRPLNPLPTCMFTLSLAHQPAS